MALLGRPRRWPAALPGFLPWLGAMACAMLPLLLASGEVAGWAPLVGGLADRAPLASAWLLAGVVVATLPREGDARWLLPLVGATSLAAAFGLVQAFGYDPPGFVPFGRLRPAYPFQGLSQAVEVILPCLLLAVALLPDLRRRPLPWLLLCLPLALEAGFLSSNAGRLAMLGGLGLGLWRQPDRRIGWIAAGVLYVCGELLRPLLGAGGGDRLTGGIPRGVEARMAIAEASAGKAATTPLGLGLGQFETDYPAWRPEAEAMLDREPLREAGRLRQPKTPHNEPLLGLLESGWLGAALLAAMLARLVTARRRLAPGPRPTDGAWLALGVMALVRSPFSDNPVALGLAALLLAEDLRGLGAAAAESVVAPASKIRRALVAAPLALGLLAVLPAWPQWRGEQLSARAVAGEAFDAEAMLHATEARPWDQRSWVLLGSYYLAAGRHDDARTCLRQAMMVAPYDLSALTAAIKVELEAPDGDEVLMRGLIARAESFAPYEPSVQDARLLWLRHYRDAYRSTAVAMVRQGMPGANAYWAAMNLAEARIAQVEGDREAMVSGLMQAASYLPGDQALIERTARLQEVDQLLLEELCLRLFPDWPQLTRG